MDSEHECNTSLVPPIPVDHRESYVSLDPRTFVDDDDDLPYVSLDPRTFVDDPLDSFYPQNYGFLEDYPLSVIEPAPPEVKLTAIKRCLSLIPRVLEDVAERRGRSMREVGMVAFWLGERILRSLDEVERVRKARRCLLSITSNMHNGSRYRRELNTFAFDLGSDETEPFHTRLYEPHVNRVNFLARLLGRGMEQKVRQISFVAGLIHSRYIGGHDQEHMIGILARFISELGIWAQKLEGVVAELGLVSIAPGKAPLEDPLTAVFRQVEVLRQAEVTPCLRIQ